MLVRRRQPGHHVEDVKPADDRVPAPMAMSALIELSAAEFETLVAELFGQASSHVDGLRVTEHDRVRGVDGTYDFDATVRYRWAGMEFRGVAPVAAGPRRNAAEVVSHRPLRSEPPGTPRRPSHRSRRTKRGNRVGDRSRRSAPDSRTRPEAAEPHCHSRCQDGTREADGGRGWACRPLAETPRERQLRGRRASALVRLSRLRGGSAPAGSMAFWSPSSARTSSCGRLLRPGSQDRRRPYGVPTDRPSSARAVRAISRGGTA